MTRRHNPPKDATPPERASLALYSCYGEGTAQKRFISFYHSLGIHWLLLKAKISLKKFKKKQRKFLNLTTTET